MILLKTQMSSYIELAGLHEWVDKEVLLFFYYQRFGSHLCIVVLIDSLCNIFHICPKIFISFYS